jgi:hypothetical protein
MPDHFKIHRSVNRTIYKKFRITVKPQFNVFMGPPKHGLKWRKHCTYGHWAGTLQNCRKCKMWEWKMGFYCNWISGQWSRMPSPLAINVLPVELSFCFIFYSSIAEGRAYYCHCQFQSPPPPRLHCQGKCVAVEQTSEYKGSTNFCYLFRFHKVMS